MNKARLRDSQPPVRRVRPAAGRLSVQGERRAPRPWTRDQRAIFLHHLAVEETLAAALEATMASRSEALAERLRSRAFARAWDRCVADRMARLPEMLLDHVVDGLRGGAGTTDATIRQAASIGQWLLEKCLPGLTGPKMNGPTARARAPAAVSQGSEQGSTDAMDREIDRTINARLDEVRLRLQQLGPTLEGPDVAATEPPATQ